MFILQMPEKPIFIKGAGVLAVTSPQCGRCFVLLYNPLKGPKRHTLNDFGGKIDSEMDGGSPHKCANREMLEETYNYWGLFIPSQTDQIPFFVNGPQLGEWNFGGYYCHARFIPYMSSLAMNILADGVLDNFSQRWFIWIDIDSLINKKILLNHRLRFPELRNTLITIRDKVISGFFMLSWILKERIVLCTKQCPEKDARMHYCNAIEGQVAKNTVSNTLALDAEVVLRNSPFLISDSTKPLTNYLSTSFWGLLHRLRLLKKPRLCDCDEPLFIEFEEALQKIQCLEEWKSAMVVMLSSANRVLSPLIQVCAKEHKVLQFLITKCLQVCQMHDDYSMEKSQSDFQELASNMSKINLEKKHVDLFIFNPTIISYTGIPICAADPALFLEWRKLREDRRIDLDTTVVAVAHDLQVLEDFLILEQHTEKEIKLLIPYYGEKLNSLPLDDELSNSTEKSSVSICKHSHIGTTSKYTETFETLAINSAFCNNVIQNSTSVRNLRKEQDKFSANLIVTPSRLIRCT